MIKVARGGISIDSVDIVHLKKVGRGPLGLYMIGTVGTNMALTKPLTKQILYTRALC